jgi:hypothetical protein
MRIRSDVDRQMFINRVLFAIIMAVVLMLASAKFIHKIVL